MIEAIRSFWCRIAHRRFRVREVPPRERFSGRYYDVKCVRCGKLDVEVEDL